MSKHSESVPAWPNGSIDLNAVHDDARGGRDFHENGFIKKHLLVPEVEVAPAVEEQTETEMKVADAATDAKS